MRINLRLIKARINKLKLEKLTPKVIDLEHAIRSLGIPVNEYERMYSTVMVRKGVPHVTVKSRRMPHRFVFNTTISYADIKAVQNVSGHYRLHEHVWRRKLNPMPTIWISPYVRVYFRYVMSKLLRTAKLSEWLVIKFTTELRNTLLKGIL